MKLVRHVIVELIASSIAGVILWLIGSVDLSLANIDASKLKIPLKPTALVSQQSQSNENHVLITFNPEVHSEQKPRLTLKFNIDNTNSPLSDYDFNILVLQKLRDSWIKCGVRIEPYDKPNDSKFRMYWQPLGKEVNALFQVTGVKSRKQKYVFESYQIKLNSTNPLGADYFHIINRKFGQILGIPLNDRPDSVMFKISDLKLIPDQPSDKDIEECKYVLDQMDLVRTQRNIDNI